MSEQKMGTQYAREICEIFNEIAEKTEVPAIKDSLAALSSDLESVHKKLYFKTQKGTEDMQKMVADMEALKDKLLACKDAGEAETLCAPICNTLEQVIKHVKTMKVRMT